MRLETPGQGIAPTELIRKVKGKVFPAYNNANDSTGEGAYGQLLNILSFLDDSKETAAAVIKSAILDAVTGIVGFYADMFAATFDLTLVMTSVQFLGSLAGA